jgi:hypothetical protein
MQNEKGSILAETPLFAFIAIAFLAGALKVHESWKKRASEIIQDRNEKIRLLRLEKTKDIFPNSVPVSVLRGHSHDAPQK